MGKDFAHHDIKIMRLSIFFSTKSVDDADLPKFLLSAIYGTSLSVGDTHWVFLFTGTPLFVLIFHKSQTLY